jgi:hypothetical protein
MKTGLAQNITEEKLLYTMAASMEQVKLFE